MSKPASRQSVKDWMIRQLLTSPRAYVDSATGEVNLTELAESAAREFGIDDQGGPLDDETHWIWEIPIEAEAFVPSAGQRAALRREYEDLEAQEGAYNGHGTR
jgi:hypothetical protein